MIKKNVFSRLKRYIKYNFIGTRYEWERDFENMFHIFDKNLTTLSPSNILDVGCNDGSRTIRIADHFNVSLNNVYGIDHNDELIKSCKETFNAINIDLEIDDLPYKSNSFDLVICNQVLEHLKRYTEVLNDIIRVTKKRGYIVIGIPNLAHLINRIYLLFGLQPICIHLDSNHVRSFTHKNFLNKLASIERIKIIDCRGVLMYPLPFFLANRITDYFAGLSGNVCYLLQKIE